MSWKLLQAIRLCAVVLIGVAVATSTSAQDRVKESATKGTGDVTLTASLVKTGLYMVSGGGSNTLLRLSPSGILLVDGKLSENYRPLMSQVRKITKLGDLPVRVVVLTDHHESVSGTNAQFAQKGVAIIAQTNVQRNLESYAPASGGKIPPPSFTYDREYVVRLGPVDVQLMHFGNAHTSGDTVVYFPWMKVVAVGDLYTSGTPDPDFSAGGSLVGWGPVLAEILKLDIDVVVPQTGPTVKRGDVEAFKAKIDTLVARATALVANGVPKDRLMAELRTDDLGWRFDFTPEQLDRFYAELSQAK